MAAAVESWLQNILCTRIRLRYSVFMYIYQCNQWHSTHGAGGGLDKGSILLEKLQERTI